MPHVVAGIEAFTHLYCLNIKCRLIQPLGICKRFQKQSALTPAFKKLRSHRFQACLTESKVDLTEENTATELLFFGNCPVKVDFQ